MTDDDLRLLAISDAIEEGVIFSKFLVFTVPENEVPDPVVGSVILYSPPAERDLEPSTDDPFPSAPSKASNFKVSQADSVRKLLEKFEALQFTPKSSGNNHELLNESQNLIKTLEKES